MNRSESGRRAMLALVGALPQAGPPAVAPTVDSLLDEGQAAERRGQRAEARRLYEQALGEMSGDAEGRRAPTTLRWIARTYVGDADMDAALDCLAAAVASAEAWGDESACGHAINVQAVVMWQLGELDDAERLYLTARARAIRAGDAKLAAMTAQNLGVIANVRGDHAEAQRHYEASLAEYRSLGLAKDVIVALNNLGLLHTHSQQWEAAERDFREAVQISDAVGDVSARILLDVNLAEMWVARAEFPRAQQCVRHAMDLAAGAGDASAIGQASKLLGVIARETGDVTEAEEQFRRADEIARSRQDVLLEAEVARETGELARRQGRNGLVLRHLNRAHKLFSQLRARRDVADIGLRTGRLEDEFLQVARRWGESIEAKDRYTQGHCVRVSDLACAMAAELGIIGQELFWFRIGALLHDVGKIVIPEEVLNKPGKLTEEEWALMRSHTTAGVEMLSGIEFPWDVVPVIRSHHERFDGRGYPDQLAGEGIPLVARILCTADVYDALTSVRSYKRALSHQQAVELMRQDVGTMFDPAVFAVFERIVPSWAQRLSRVAAPTNTAEALIAVPNPSERDPRSHELDDLTRMPLRRAFRETAQRVLDARKTTERPVSLLVIDIDHFKLINDTFGHLQGDDVLRLMADVLRVQTRPTDFVARYAGDEFVALLPGSSLDDAMAIGERLRAGVEQSSCVRRDGSDEPVRVTLSIGVATAPLHGDALDTLFAAADGALYGSKRNGRNAVSSASGPGTTREATLLLDTFVGRTAERQRLRRLLDAAASGTPGVLSIVGSAGIGKSTLVRRLGPEIGVRSGSLLIGHCLEADVRPPYGPWADIIRAIHALHIVPAKPWRELGRLVPGLGVAIEGANSGTNGPAQSAPYVLMQEIEEYLTAATAERPLVVILDDMQWADAETWDVLELIAPRLADQRLLICLTVRREDVSATGAQRLARLSRHANFAEIALGRLSHDEVEQWLRSALGGQTPDALLVEHVLAQTEGNPLFAVQTLRSLAEDGGLQLEDGVWVFAPVADSPPPTAVRDLLARRLSRLSDKTRDVLTSAAVFGTTFDAELLLSAVSHGEDVVFDALDDGVRALVLAPVADRGPTEYAFTHGLLADELRRAGSPLRLRRVHERVARLLEQQGQQAPAELAEHFDRAGCAADAYRYALLAADRALQVYAHDAAVTCLAMAERNARAPREHAEVLWQLAALDEIVGRYDQAESRCLRLLAEHADGADALCVARPARRMRERLRLMRGAPAHDVLLACSTLHGEAHEAGDHAEAVALLMMLSQVHARIGDDVSAEATARKAITNAVALNDPALNAEAIMRLGSTVLIATPAEAVLHYRQALDIFNVLQDRRGQLRCQINIGVACDRAGNHPAAELSYATALDMGREVKAVDLTALASMNLGVVLMKTGRFGEARHRFDETMRLYRSINNEPHRLSALYNLAHLARERGDPAGAIELYAASSHLAQKLGQFDVHVGALCGLGLAELSLGQFASAQAQLTSALQLLAGRERRWYQGRELLIALDVQLLLGRGDRDAALTRLQATLDEVEQHDQYAAVWLAAACAIALPHDRNLTTAWRTLTRKYAVHARALGYEPLLARLRFVDADEALVAAA